MITDLAGTPVWSADQLPFGQTTPHASNTINQHLRFPGQYSDTESGLHYNWHRYYDPHTGRYLTADPIGLRGGWNVYGYANLSPINYNDPHGLSAGAAVVETAIGIGTGVAIAYAMAPPEQTRLWEER